LGSVGADTAELFAVPVDAIPSAFTFGLPICLTETAGEVSLVGIRPVATIGTGFEYLGARVRSFEPAQGHASVGSARGWPPEGVSEEELSDLDGFEPSVGCDSRASGGTQTEVLIGLRATGPDGGGWNAVDVTYTVDGRPAVLRVDNEYYVCGESVRDNCEA
jgi:hypothetical protein